MNILNFLAELDSIGFIVMRVFLSILWQSSILLGGIGMLVYLLRRKKESVRYALWVAAILVIPVLPLLTWGISELGTPHAEIKVMPVYNAPVEKVPAIPIENINRISQYQEISGIHETHSDKPGERLKVNIKPQAVPVPARESFNEIDLLRLKDYPWALLFVGYAFIIVLFSLGIIVGRLRIRNWIIRSDPVMDFRIIDIFQRVREQLSLSRDIIIVENEHAPAPMTCRTLHPAVILPAGYGRKLSDDELQAVAIHELSHVKRNDMLILTLISLVRAVFFFNPLVWLAVREVSYLTECSCDSDVLEFTGEPVFYADMLTRIAHELPDRVLTIELAVGIVFSKSMFFRRIRAILSEHRDRIRKFSRLALTGTVFAAVLSLVAAVVLPLGEARKRGEMVTVSGKVVYEGETVPGATIYFNDINEKHIEKVAKTNKNGLYSFDISVSRLTGDRWSYPVVIAESKKYALGWTQIKSTIPLDNLKINLNEKTSISGTVKDSSGNPVKGAEVAIRRLYSISTFTAAAVLYDNSPLSLAAKTNNKGSFLLNNIPTDVSALLSVKKNGFAETIERLSQLSDNKINVTLNPEGRIEGRVFFSDTGKSAKNVRVIAKKSGSSQKDFEASTDKKGNFTFTNMSSDNYTLYIVFGGDFPDWTAEKKENVIIKEGETTSGIEINLIRGGIVTGRVVDEDTGEPVPNHFVSYHDPKLDDYISKVLYTTTDKNGMFKFRVPPGTARIMTSKPEGYLQPEWWVQGIRADDFRIKVDVEVAEGGTAAVSKFTFKKGLTLSGTTRMDDGKPVAGVSVSYGADFSKVTTLSDLNGVITIKGLKKDEHLKLKALHKELQLRGKLEVDVRPESNADILLEKFETAGITGRLTDTEGNPVSGGRIMLSWFGDGVDQGYMQSSTSTSEDGSFEFDNLIIGDKYYIRAEADGYIYDNRLHSENMFTAVENMPPHKDIVLERKGDRWLEGKVVDQNGNPVVGANVERHATDADGNFRIDNITGVVIRELRITYKNFVMFNFRYVLTNRNHVFTLVEGKNKFAGKVVDSDGNTIKDGHVSINPIWHPSGKYRRTTKMGTEGIFKYENVIEDYVNLTVYSKEKGFKKFENIKTGRDNIVLVFDKPDESEEPEWNFNNKGTVILEGKSAPELDVDRWVSGNPVKIGDLKGKVIVLDFFTKEEPWQGIYSIMYEKTRFIQALQEEYGDKGVVFVGIHEQPGNDDELQKIIREKGLTYNIAVDKSSSVSESRGKTFEKYGIARRLLNIVIDKSGTVHPDIREDDLEKTIKELIKQGM